MKIKSIVAAALVACGAFSGSANAGGHLGTLDNTTVSFSGGSSGLTFTDTFTFDLTGAGAVGGGVLAFGFFAPFTITSVALTSGLTTFVDKNPSLSLFDYTGLSAGSYSLTFSGSGSGAYGGVISTFTSPVPEASSLALMLAGLGVVGFVARRRKQD